MNDAEASLKTMSLRSMINLQSYETTLMLYLSVLREDIGMSWFRGAPEPHHDQERWMRVQGSVRACDTIEDRADELEICGKQASSRESRLWYRLVRCFYKHDPDPPNSFAGEGFQSDTIVLEALNDLA